MQHDEVIWQIIRHNHCSFMSKIDTGNFCRNPYNVTGICNQSSCPLSNSRYATIRDHEGVFYLYMKSIERAHLPNKLWERVKLPRNYLNAIKIIDKHMMFWPKLLVHKVKQRLTKMTQMRIRIRKLSLKIREKIMSVPRNQTKRDARRLDKAEKAALISKNIEEELIKRLKEGIYDPEWPEILKAYDNIGDKFDKGFKEIKEYVEGDDELEEEDDIEDIGKYTMTGIDYAKDESEEEDDVVEADRKPNRRDLRLVSKSKMKRAVIVEVCSKAFDRCLVFWSLFAVLLC
ncbi:hypothetical protein RND81_02G241100 [Saponaria officinalis]|uniref:Protein MAK16 homolog n=1 Tax=Saponaria officinalis TaxID=3572 RepID=A0AAW1MT65_SAPOF